jgi:hypothetical protein
VSDVLVKLMLGAMCGAIAHLYWIERRWPAVVCWAISAAAWTANGVITALIDHRDRVGRP